MTIRIIRRKRIRRIKVMHNGRDVVVGQRKYT
jgi:hypothetical protein